MAKICRKDSWSVHTCGRKRLASPRLVKLRKDFRPLQVPREKLAHGIGNRLTTKSDRKGKSSGQKDGSGSGDKVSAVDESDKIEGLPPRMLLPISAACESLRGKLQKLVTDSEHRKRQCLNGGTCRTPTTTQPDAKTELPKLGTILNPMDNTPLSSDTFVTQNTEVRHLGLPSSDTAGKAAVELPKLVKQSSVNKKNDLIKKVDSDSKPLVDELAAIQVVTAKEVMEAAVTGEEGLFFPRTRDVFEQSAERQILRYERQDGLPEDRINKNTFSEFKRSAHEHLTEFYDRSGLELQRYNSESRLLFKQKYDTLGIDRLCSTKSAKVAVASMESEIRNQHSRASSLRRKDQQKDWVIEFREILQPFPRSTAVCSILTYLEEHINNTNDGELSARHFELLLTKFSRGHLLLSEVVSLLYAIRPIFKLTPEMFIDIVKDRLKPLYPRPIDHTSFDHRFKNWLYNKRIKMIVSSFDEDEDGKLNYREFRNLLGKAFSHDDGLKKTMIPESEQAFIELTLKLNICPPPGGMLDTDGLRRLFDGDFFKTKEETIQRLETHTKRIGVLEVINAANKIKGLVASDSFAGNRRTPNKKSILTEQRKSRLC